MSLLTLNLLIFLLQLVLKDQFVYLIPVPWIIQQFCMKLVMLSRSSDWPGIPSTITMLLASESIPNKWSLLMFVLLQSP